MSCNVHIYKIDKRYQWEHKLNKQTYIYIKPTFNDSYIQRLDNGCYKLSISDHNVDNPITFYVFIKDFTRSNVNPIKN